jgi:hypothetical protein
VRDNGIGIAPDMLPRHHLTKPIDPDELQKLMSTAALSQA